MDLLNRFLQKGSIFFVQPSGDPSYLTGACAFIGHSRASAPVPLVSGGTEESAVGGQLDIELKNARHSGRKANRPNEAMKVRDILQVLDRITGGRCVVDAADLASGNHRFVITKSSGIAGKECTEMPGLVYGNPDAPVTKIAVVMTLTKSCIELAAATGVQAIVAHHPIADGTSCDGVTLRNYLSLYGIAVFECHEAFHGLHPGIAFIHGHRVLRKEIAFAGIPGNVMFAGRALEGIATLGDIVERIERFSGLQEEQGMARKYTFSGSVYFERMRSRGLYTTAIDRIRQRVAGAGMIDFFARPLR